AVDALDRPRSRRTKPATADSIRAAIERAAASVFPAAGEGEDVRFSTAGLAGAALVARGRAVHVNAFPSDAHRRSTRHV
ncbi:MAG TPA: DUF6569 family protein, partial [Vicinamibacterales bacterium]|nr:DUF6569 family protein [Vicinamibacterales bacterium]